MRKAEQLALTLSLLAGAAFIAACGGSGEPRLFPPEASSTPGSSSLAESAVASPPAQAIQPTETPQPPYDFSLITPVPPSEPPPVDPLLGTPDRFAAQSITEAMITAGFDLTRTEFFVFSLPGGEQNMLVIDQQNDLVVALANDDETTAGSDLEPMLNGLVASEALERANVGRIVYNLHYLDEQGVEVFTLIMTQPVDTLIAFRTGAITREEALATTHIEIRAVGPQ